MRCKPLLPSIYLSVKTGPYYRHNCHRCCLFFFLSLALFCCCCCCCCCCVFLCFVFCFFWGGKHFLLLIAKKKRCKPFLPITCPSVSQKPCRYCQHDRHRCLSSRIMNNLQPRLPTPTNHPSLPYLSSPPVLLSNRVDKVQFSVALTSTETVSLLGTDSPGRPPRLSHSS